MTRGRFIQASRAVGVLLLALAALALAAGQARAQGARPAADGAESARGSLEEIRTKRRVLLLLARPATVDVREPWRAALEAGLATNPQQLGRRQRYVYNAVARKLNKYINKYQSMSAVASAADADFIVIFSLLRYRLILGTLYPFGEMYVITKPAEGPPRVLWWSEKEMYVEDAADALIKALKNSRNEK